MGKKKKAKSNAVPETVEHKDIYRLSLKFAPPKIDLRKAKIADCYGDPHWATLMIDHQKPDDVTRKEFDFYGWVYPFMGPEDLLFYLYAIVVEYGKDRRIDCLDSYMYSVDRNMDKLQTILSEEDQATLKNAFLQIWEIGGDDFADFGGCKNIQKLIGVTVERW